MKTTTQKPNTHLGLSPICRNLLIGTLVLEAVSAVYGQEKPAASSTTGAAPSPAAVRLEGTDLHLGSLPPIAFHGFLSQGFLDSSKYNYLGDSTRGSFMLTEAGINATIDPFPHTRITAQGFLFDVGKVGQFNPVLDYALIDYNFCSAFGIRAGRIIRPEGIYNSVQSIDLARTSILLPQGMYDARYRDFSGAVDGGSLYGDINLKKAGDLSYEAYGGMVNLADDGGIARYLEDAFHTPPTQYAGVGGFPQAGVQLWWNTPLQGLRAGVALTEAFGFSYDFNVNVPPAFGGGFYHNVLDVPEEHYSLEYQVGSWTFQAEYKYQDYYTRVQHGGRTSPTTHNASDVWYVGAAYRAAKWLEVGTYYTEDYANLGNRSGAGTPVPSDSYQKDVALSFRFDVKPWWIVKVEGHAINGTALLHDNRDNPTRNGDEWYMLAVKTTFSF